MIRLQLIYVFQIVSTGCRPEAQMQFHTITSARKRKYDIMDYRSSDS